MEQNKSMTRTAPEKVFKIIWFALFCSIGLFVFLAATSAPLSFPNLVGDVSAQPVVFVFALMAIVNILVALQLPALILKIEIKKRGVPSTDDQILKLAFMPYVIRLALYEAAVLFGFLGSIFLKNSAFMLPIAVLVLVLFLLSRPEIATLKRMMRLPRN
jgi:hypothetical protein